MIQTLWISGILLRAGESVMRTAWVHGQRPPHLKFVSREAGSCHLSSKLYPLKCLRPSVLISRSSGEKSLFPRLKAKGAEGITSFDAPYTSEHLLTWVHALFHNLNLLSLGFCFPALGVFVVPLLCHFRLFWNLWTAARQASLSFTIS